MPVKRTEEDILSKAPITLHLGQTDYSVPILSINKTRAWRKKLAEDLGSVVQGFGSASSTAALTQGLTGALIEFPERLAELIFAYAPELPRDQVLDEATEEQIAAAFSRVMEVAFPFLPQLAMVQQVGRVPAAATGRLQ